MRRVLSILFLSWGLVELVPPLTAAEIKINWGGDAALAPTTDQEYVSTVNRMPASNSVQRLNPPIFLWPYYENPSLFSSAGVLRIFNFQLTTNGSFASPVWNLTLTNNFYNFFPSITNADGSTWSNSVSWRVRYLNSNGSVAMGTNPVHTFTMPASAEKWDRSCFADRTYLNTLSNLHPRILVKSTNLAAYRAQIQNWESSGFGTVFGGALYQDFTNRISLLGTAYWTTDGATLTAQPAWQTMGNAFAMLGAGYWGVTNAWFTNALNNASPSVGSVFTNFCMQVEAAGYDRIEAYGGAIDALTGLGLAYDLCFNFLNAEQKALGLRLMENWAGFYIFEDWYFHGSETNLDRVYGGRNLVMNYPSPALNDDSHQRHDRAALMLCLGGMGDSPKLDYYAEWFLSFYIARFDPFNYATEDPRQYAAISTILDWPRAFHPWVMACTMFYDKKLTNAPVYTEFADLTLFQTPIGWRATMNPWGENENYADFTVNKGPYTYAAFKVLARMNGRGDWLRANTRAVALGGSENIEVNTAVWMQEIAGLQWPAPTEADRNTNSFIDPVRGWFVGLSTKPTDYGVASNGVGVILRAGPTGQGRSGLGFNEGNVEIWAYGANVTHAGAGRYESAATFFNGLFVDGIGVNNEIRGNARPIHSRFSHFTNWGGGLYVCADITGSMNLSNYVGGGAANMQSTFQSQARVNYLQTSNARPYIQEVKRRAISTTSNNLYFFFYDTLKTFPTNLAQFQMKLGAFPTNCTGVDLATMSYVYRSTNNWTGRSNVTTKVQHFRPSSALGVLSLTNIGINPRGTNELCYWKQNPFTGEKYNYTNDWLNPMGAHDTVDDDDPYPANSFWFYPKVASSNDSFFWGVFPSYGEVDHWTVDVKSDGYTVGVTSIVHNVSNLISLNTNNVTGGSGPFAGQLTHLFDPEGTNTITISEDPPETPTGLAASPGNTLVNLEWGVSALADVYYVKSGTVSGSLSTFTSTAGVTAQESGLANGTLRYYSVLASNQYGVSAWSSEVSATPTGVTVRMVIGGGARVGGGTSQ